MHATPSEHRAPETASEPLTSAQRRYLFRLMAERGVEAEHAHDELKRLFKVSSLGDVTKKEASNLIDYLANHEKGGNGHGPSL